MIWCVDSERAVIGCVLYDNQASALAFERLRPEHFYDPAHISIWERMAAEQARGKFVEPVSLAAALAGHPSFKGIGYLADLVDRAYLPALGSAIDTVLDRATRRRLVDLSKDLQERADALGDDAFDHVASAERSITALLNDSAPSDNNLVGARHSALTTVEEIEQEALSGREKGAMTGLRCFDYRMRGLRPGWLVIVAGRPSMGKTALARAAAFGCARKNPHHQVVFFALEMDRRELDERSLSQLSYEDGDGIAYKDMDGVSLVLGDRLRLRKLAERVPHNLLIDDSPILSVSYVRRRVLALKRKGPIAAVFIDYLQIMDRPKADGRNDAAIIGEMTKSLKQLAREAGTCVVLLSQINRGVESRDDKRPQLSDLRESGSIEQDANAVLFPYRQVYYEERNEPQAGSSADKVQAWEMRCEEFRRRMDVICAKVRRSAVGTDHQVYFAEYDVVEDQANVEPFERRARA